MAKKTVDEFEVILDYLLGQGQNAYFDKVTIQSIQDCQQLDSNTQMVLFNIIDTYLYDAGTTRAY